MAEHVAIRPEDIEIEHTMPGPIIHIFPPDTIESILFDIAKGQFLEDLTNGIIEECEKQLKKEMPDYMIWALTHMKEEIKLAHKHADECAHEFIKKVNENANDGITKNP